MLSMREICPQIPAERKQREVPNISWTFLIFLSIMYTNFTQLSSPIFTFRPNFHKVFSGRNYENFILLTKRRIKVQYLMPRRLSSDYI